MCSSPLTNCIVCLGVDFFRRHNRPVEQREDGSWWAEGYRLGRCLDVDETESNNDVINDESEEEAA